MPTGKDYKWHKLASDFPSGLDTETDPTKLKDGFTPDGYGFDIDYPGRLVKGTIGSGSTPIKQAGTGNLSAYTHYFRRAWKISTTNLVYNAPEYTASELAQDLGSLSFTEDTGSLITFFPIGGGNMFVAKATGGYIVPNAASFNGDYQHGNIEEAARVATNGNAIPFDGAAWISNGYGLMVWDGNKIVEISRLIRGEVSTSIANQALTVDIGKRRIIGGTKFVYDTAIKKFFVYKDTATDFRWTSQSIKDPTGKPFIIPKVAFNFDNTTGADAEIKLQIKRDKYGEWDPEETVSITKGEDEYNRKEHAFDPPLNAREWTMRITNMPTHIHIRQIDMWAAFTLEESSPSE
jgi:hypothetical protein